MAEVKGLNGDVLEKQMEIPILKIFFSPLAAWRTPAGECMETKIRTGLSTRPLSLHGSMVV